MRSRRHPFGRRRPGRRGAMPRLHGVHGRLPVGRAGSRARLPADCGAAPADRRVDPGMRAPSPRSRNPRPLPGDALGRAPRVPLRLVPGTGFPGHRPVRRMRKRVRGRADEGSHIASPAGHLFALCRPLSFRDGAAGSGGTPLRSPFLLHGSQEEGRVAGGRKGRIEPRSDPERAGTGVDYSSKRIPQRCSLLAAALARVAPDQARTFGDVLRFRMELSTSCEGCFSCVAACPTGALESSSPGPRLNEAACTGCELCREFCLKGAIRIHPKGEAANRPG